MRDKHETLPSPPPPNMMCWKAFSPSFFFATEAGAVCYADDLGHCSDVQQLSSAVDRLVFYEAERRLVVITRSLLMTQLQVCAHKRIIHRRTTLLLA